MQVQVEIEFEQLVKIARGLPDAQWQKMKAGVENTKPTRKTREEFRVFLLNGPVLTEEEIREIEEARKAINKRRKV